MGVKIRMDGIKTKKFNMDQVSLEVEEENVPKVEAILEKVKEAADVITELEGDNETMQAENDQIKDENETMKKENEELKDEDSERVQKMVEEKKNLEDAADECGIKKEDRKGMKKRDLKVAIIKSKCENFDASDKSDDYINARYDFIRENLSKERENNSEIESFNKVVQDSKKKDGQKTDPREGFISKTKDLYKEK